MESEDLNGNQKTSNFRNQLKSSYFLPNFPIKRINPFSDLERFRILKNSNTNSISAYGAERKKELINDPNWALPFA